MVVDRIEISSTIPSIPSAMIQSPIWNGISKIKVREPKKFSTESLAARATTRPPIPSPAMSPVISKPMRPRKKRRVRPMTMRRPRLVRIGRKSFSARSLSAIFGVSRLIRNWTTAMASQPIPTVVITRARNSTAALGSGGKESCLTR